MSELKPVLGPALAPILVQAVLRDPAVRRIHFRIGPYAVTPAMFEQVAGLIGNGKLRVKIDPKLGGGAEYDMAENTFYLRTATTDTVPKQSLIIHEAVHAGFDAFCVRNMTVADSESAAYIAQCCFARLKSASDPSQRILVSSKDKGSDLVFQLAWEIAGKVLEETPVSAADRLQLQMAVLGHANYRHYDAKAIEKYDGVA